jgi:hypothetical protein
MRCDIHLVVIRAVGGQVVDHRGLHAAHDFQDAFLVLDVGVQHVDVAREVCQAPGIGLGPQQGVHLLPATARWRMRLAPMKPPAPVTRIFVPCDSTSGEPVQDTAGIEPGFFAVEML